VKVPVVGNNVDLILLNCGPKEIVNHAVFSSPDSYIALGELKGGIDPAGADEHWKTARTALNRIYRSFAAVETKPRIFFVGAAIKTAMAREIWRQLEDGILDNAANLTEDAQISSLALWLCRL
jgi:type II restriction enzyme